MAGSRKRTGFVLPDRLGSNAGGGMMYPYGETPGSVGTDQVEFATCTRDSYTGSITW